MGSLEGFCFVPNPLSVQWKHSTNSPVEAVWQFLALPGLEGFQRAGKLLSVWADALKMGLKQSLTSPDVGCWQAQAQPALVP